MGDPAARPVCCPPVHQLRSGWPARRERVSFGEVELLNPMKELRVQRGAWWRPDGSGQVRHDRPGGSLHLRAQLLEPAVDVVLREVFDADDGGQDRSGPPLSPI